MRNRPAEGDGNAVLETLFTRKRGIADQLRPTVLEYQKDLLLIEGRTFGVKLNEEIAREIHDTVNWLRVVLQCARKNCGLPGRLRFHFVRNSIIFQFEHYIPRQGNLGKKKQEKHGGWTDAFPPLRLLWPDGTPVVSSSISES